MTPHTNKPVSPDNTNDSKKIKAVFLCSNDNLGGAAVVTRRLVQALNKENVDASMLVFNRLSDDPAVTAVNVGRFHRGFTFLSERLQIALANGFSRTNLFKVSTASRGLSIVKHPLIQQADVIILSWINQGFLSLKEIQRLSRLGKPIIWVMHDMWNLTGICHHAHECLGYLHTCGNCQFLRGNRANDLSASVWRRKKKLYDSANITFVAVSNWLADCCHKSSLLKGRDIRVIPNAFPIKSFYTKPRMKLEMIPDNLKLIVMGAARLDDPIKGFPIAIKTLNHIFDNHPDAARSSIAVFFGDIRDHSILDSLRFPHIELGTINDSKILRDLYARASVVLSSSLYETLPGTLIEGQAAGALPVSFGRGGQSDIIDHLSTGYIARYKDHEDLADGILWALDRTPDRDSLHNSVADRFSARSIALRFSDLFKQLLDKPLSTKNVNPSND